jgi:uncharacterized membrane protein
MFRFVHHIGTFLLLAATAFLIVTTISAPVINNIGILTVDLRDGGNQGSEISFGTFGWCIQDGRSDGKDLCSKSKLGYSPVTVVNTVDNAAFSDAAERTTRRLTKVLVLHPVATCLSFLGFIMAAGAGVVGSFLASLVALLAFLVTLVVLVVDFVLFAIIKNRVNDDDRLSGAHAYYSVGMWCVLAAGVATFLAAVILFITCCTGRAKKHRQTRKVEGYTSPPRTTRRRFWQRRR